eukprot:2904006-Amphidinium_carterae.1
MAWWQEGSLLWNLSWNIGNLHWQINRLKTGGYRDSQQLHVCTTEEYKKRVGLGTLGVGMGVPDPVCNA